MKKVLLVLAMLICCFNSWATQYYVSAAGNSSNNGTSTSTTWSFSYLQNRISAGIIHAGDIVSFKQGDTFVGALSLASYNGQETGTSSAPITFNSYNATPLSSAKPKFTGKASGITTALFTTDLAYIYFDNLEIIDPTVNFTTDPNRLIKSKIERGIVLEGSHCKITNCKMTKIGVCVFTPGGTGTGFHNIDYNEFGDLTMVVDTPDDIDGLDTNGDGNPDGDGIAGEPGYPVPNSNAGGDQPGNDDDYGANPWVTGSSNNTFTHNYCYNLWAHSYDYLQDGGFVEFYGTSVSNNDISYNTCINSVGILEEAGSGTASNNKFNYNKFINCGKSIYFHTANTNTQFCNNIFIETITPINNDGSAIFGGTSGTKTIKNNVFWITNGIAVYSNSTSITHDNNVYRMPSGNIGITLSANERQSTTASLFTNISGTDATVWDTHPLTGSLLINAGAPISGLTLDFDGNVVGNPPEIGVYEFSGSAALTANATYSPIACNGGSTNVVVSGVGGTAPYSGTGTFSRTAGTYTFTITDAVAATASTTITITQPTALTGNANGGPGQVVFSTVAGGTPPYQYNVDAGTYQTSATVTGITAGAHTGHIKDANGCIINKSVTVTAPVVNTWYCSSSYTGTTSDGHQTTPWKSMQAVVDAGNAGTIKAGDIVLFKCGDVFISPNQWGGAQWWGNNRGGGTCPSNVTFSKYGTGANPNFLFPYPSSVKTGNRMVWSFEGVSGIIIDGWDFNDYRFPDGDGVTPGHQEKDAVTFAYTSECLLIGEQGASNSTANNCIIRNCNFNKVGLGVVIGGDGNTVTNCTMNNLLNVISTDVDVNGNPAPTEDYGANGITISGDNNIVTYNTIKSAWAASRDFVWNGGALEMYGSCNNNVIMYNKFIDCGGIAEFGAQCAATCTANDNLFAYNFIYNCGGLSYVNYNSTFATVASNIQYINNVIIEDVNSRFSGPNTGYGVPDGRTMTAASAFDSYLFLFGSSSPASNIFTIKNNFIYLSSGLKVGQNSTKVTRQNNVYKFGGSSSLNWTAGTGDVTTTTAISNIFTNTLPTDVTTWDFHPKTGSPLINAGMDATAAPHFPSVDFEGVAITLPINVGIYETTGTGALAAASSVTTPIPCPGGSGVITVTATGGSTPYTGTGTFTRAAGTYTFTVTDNSSGSATTTITISDPTTITATATAGTILINGGSTTITVSGVSGGAGSYQYKLDNGAYGTSTTFSGVLAGSHIVTIKDANACTITKSVTITEPAVLTVSASATPILCNGSQSTVTVSASGGVSPYTGTGTFLKAAGTWSFSVTDANGATNSTSVTITQPTVITATLSAGTITVAGGTTTINVNNTTGGVGPYTYKLNAGSYQSSNFFANQPAGTYTVTIKDANGCTITRTITITQPGALVASSSANSILCNGGTTTVTVNAVGGVGPYTGAGSFTRSAGTYTFTVTDANSATANTTITISQPVALSGTATGGTILVNGGTTTITLSSVAGGVSPYTYNLDGGAYQSGTVFSGVGAGVHSVNIKDANACILTKSVTLTQPGTLQASASGTTILCNGGTSTVTVTATGGVTPYSGTGTFTMVAGTSNYTVTDANGATSTVSITKTQPTAITGTLTSGTILVNGGTTSLTISASGGTSPYTYKLDAGSYGSATTFTGVAAGSHTVTIKDANNCTLAKTMTVTQPAALVASSTMGTILCNGGTTTITVSATGGVPPYTGTGNFVVNAGTYNYTVTDANGASSTTSKTVTQPTALSGSLASGTITVSGGTTTITVTASGGTGSLTYSLNGGSYQSGNTFSLVPAGIHTVNIKDANACIITRTITITQPSSLVAASTHGTIACNGGTTTVTVTASGGTAPYSGTGTFVVSAGSYSYTVTDAASATSTTSGTISEPADIAFSVTAGTLASDGAVTTATVNVTAGTAPYTYSLNGGAYQSGNTFSDLVAGNYTVTVKDANNCTKVSSFTIAQSAVTTLKIGVASKTNISCKGASNGSVTLLGQGGIGPYQYGKLNFLFVSYQSSATFGSLRAGTYKFYVRDSRGKTAVTYVTISSSTTPCP